MTMFDQEVLNKKRLVNSARHKKNGSKSRMCSLPSDRLTEKQIKERHGEIVSYSFSKPINWENFKKLSVCTQQEYLLHLNKEFGATMSDFASLLGITIATLRRHINTYNINVEFGRGFRMHKDQKERWHAFLIGDNECENSVAVLSDTDEANEINIIKSDEEPQPCDITPLNMDTLTVMPEMNMSEVTLKFNGAVDVNGLANTLKAVLGSNINGTILINYSAN